MQLRKLNQVGDVLSVADHSSGSELFYAYNFTSTGTPPVPLKLRVQLVGSHSAKAAADVSAGLSILASRLPACLAGSGEVVWLSGGSGWRLEQGAGRLREWSGQVNRTFSPVSPLALKCHMCRHRGQFCPLQSGRCSGRCCSYCVLHPACSKQGTIPLERAKWACSQIILDLKVRFIAALACALRIAYCSPLGAR